MEIVTWCVAVLLATLGVSLFVSEVMAFMCRKPSDEWSRFHEHRKAKGH